MFLYQKQAYVRIFVFLSFIPKKRIQKYLAGEREGFSLVELIIVIAIMAILIGVVALAVIPNIQKSRESKDLTTLDNVLSAANTAVASAKIKGSGTLTLAKPYTSFTGTLTAGSTDEKTKFENAFKEAMAGSITLGSSNVADKDITIIIDGTTGKIDVGVYSTGTTWALCERTDSDTGSGKQAFHVTN